MELLKIPKEFLTAPKFDIQAISVEVVRLSGFCRLIDTFEYLSYAECLLGAGDETVPISKPLLMNEETYIDHTGRQSRSAET